MFTDLTFSAACMLFLTWNNKPKCQYKTSRKKAFQKEFREILVKISDFRQNRAYFFWSSKLTKIWFQMNFFAFSLISSHESIQKKCSDWKIYLGYIFAGTSVEQFCQNDLIFVIFSLNLVLKLAKKIFYAKFFTPIIKYIL